MKKYLLSFFAIALIYSCSNSKQKNNKQNDTNTIHFEWSSSTMGGKEYKRATLMIPIKIDTLKYSYQMQLDTGAPWNLFYGGVVDNIVKHHPHLENKISKRDTAYYTSFKAPISMGDDNSKVEIQSGHLYPNIGKQDLKNSKNKKYLNGNMGVIGEIGVAQFIDKVLKIDFKSQTLKIQNNLTSKEKDKYSFTHFQLVGNNRIVLELKTGTKTIRVLYDTGSSITPIATFDKIKFNNFRNDTTATLDSLSGNGFGNNKATSYIGKLGKPIYLSDIRLTKQDENIFYSKNYKGLKALSKKSGVSYLIGNKFFFDKKIIIDFKNHKFGVSK